MTAKQAAQLIAAGREHEFYTGTLWKSMAAQVKKLDRYECQLCKARGRYRRGTLVHHVKHLRKRPDLALTVVDPDTGARQLITLCKQCHEEQHPEALCKPKGAAEGYNNTEMWE